MDERMYLESPSKHTRKDPGTLDPDPKDPGTLDPGKDPGTLGPWDPGTLGPDPRDPGTLDPGPPVPPTPADIARAMLYAQGALGIFQRMVDEFDDGSLGFDARGIFQRISGLFQDSAMVMVRVLEQRGFREEDWYRELGMEGEENAEPAQHS